MALREETLSIQNIVRIETHNNRVIELLQVEGEYLIDSRIVAKGLDIQHEYFKETLAKYQTRLERWGLLRFQTGVGYRPQGGGNPEKYFLLNRNQVLFAITLSRNTEEVLDWKEAIIDALDQLGKQVKSLTSPAKQKLLSAPKQCPTLEDKIMIFMHRKHEEGLVTVSIRNIQRTVRKPAEQIKAAVEELVDIKMLRKVKVKKRRGPCYERYQLR